MLTKGGEEYSGEYFVSDEWDLITAVITESLNLFRRSGRLELNLHSYSRHHGEESQQFIYPWIILSVDMSASKRGRYYTPISPEGVRNKC